MNFTQLKRIKMEEHFVNYNQALALKELGFNEPCFAYYGLNNVEDKIFFDIDPDDGELTSLNQNQFYHNNLSEIGRISAPLKSQVFKWFRDEHKLWVSFAYDEDESEELYWYVDKILKYGIGRLFFHDLIEYKTYEEAESSCIDKLIELIKEKKS